MNLSNRKKNKTTVTSKKHASRLENSCCVYYSLKTGPDSLLALKICAQHRTHGWCFTSCPRACEGFFWCDCMF